MSPEFTPKVHADELDLLDPNADLKHRADSYFGDPFSPSVPGMAECPVDVTEPFTPHEAGAEPAAERPAAPA